MNKTVWIVNQYNLPQVIRTRQSILSELLQEKGYKVCLICGSTNNKTGKNLLNSFEKIRIVNFDGSTYYMVHTIDYNNSLKRIIASLQFQYRVWKYRDLLPSPDVIVSDFAGLFGNGFLKWKRKFGTKIIYDILDLWPEGFVELGYLKKDSFITKLLYRLEHKSYREADGLIFSMQGGRKYIIDKGWSSEYGGDVDTSNIGYLTNGVDLKALDEQCKQYVLDDEDLETNKFKVVYLGSISSTNGLDVLVEAAKILQERGAMDIVILVYGYGNQENKLKKMVVDYKLNNIKFKGKLEKEYGMNLLSRCDLNIFTFRESRLWQYGVSPNKLSMYFASGKPTLSMIKPAYDLVIEYSAGISIDNDPIKVADAIQIFKNLDKKSYEELCYNSRKAAELLDYKNLVHILIDKIEN